MEIKNKKPIYIITGIFALLVIIIMILISSPSFRGNLMSGYLMIRPKVITLPKLDFCAHSTYGENKTFRFCPPNNDGKLNTYKIGSVKWIAYNKELTAPIILHDSLTSGIPEAFSALDEPGIWKTLSGNKYFGTEIRFKNGTSTYRHLTYVPGINAYLLGTVPFPLKNLKCSDLICSAEFDKENYIKDYTGIVDGNFNYYTNISSIYIDGEYEKEGQRIEFNNYPNIL